MNRYEAHVTDEWQRDTTVVQVRRLAANDLTQAVAYLAEDTDGMATLQWHLIDPQKDGREHLVPTPGIRLPHDVAVTMARAILTDAGKDADEVERLKERLANQEESIGLLGRDLDEATATNYRLATQVEALERLIEAKDAHLEREARMGTVFIRGLEMHQGTAEVEAERANHPARNVTDSLSQMASDAVRRSGPIPDLFKDIPGLFKED